MNTISEITTLDVREAINIFLSISTTVMAVLYVRFVIHECVCLRSGFPWFRVLVNKHDKPAVAAAIAWSLLSVGEAVRSTFVWEVLHFDRQHSTYASEVLPLMGALFLIILGTLCSIRIFSPAWMGNWLWIGTLVFTSILIFVNFFILDYHAMVFHFIG